MYFPISKMRTSLMLLVCFLFFGASAQYKPNSVFKNGTFYKLGISQTGVYKIDYDFLKNNGLAPENINPNKLKIFGNGYGMLPQANAIFRFDDVEENAIKVVGGEDNAFNVGDYVLFYAQGPHSWQYNATSSAFLHTYNIYADKTFYFLQTDSQNDGLQIQTQPIEVLNNPVLVNTYNDKKFIETDVTNLQKSGRLWFGDDFDKTLTRSYSFDFSGILADSRVLFRSFFASKSSRPEVSPSLGISLNGNVLGTTNFSPGSDFVIANGYQINYDINSSSFQNNGAININLTYNKSGDNEAIGYLDYLEINAIRNLNLISNELIFSNIASKNNIATTFSLSNAGAETEIWDITQNTKAKKITGSLSGSTYQFTTSTLGIIKEFVAINPSAISQRPSFEGKISNQDIHGYSTPKLVIVTHKNFISEANRLAEFKNKIGISTLVLDVEQIYTEFSSGVQDITAIRDLARMFYKRGGLENIMLFGACSYDYKNRIQPNTNFVPVYEARESFNRINSYCSDDYFAMLDDKFGEWIEGNVQDSIQIGVGRLPVRTTDEAKIVVDKIINYSSSPNALGKWRNKTCLTADNGDGATHLGDAEYMAQLIDANDKAQNINKIYVDAYPIKPTAAGNLSPQATQSLRNNIDLGSLIINYSGHGGPEQLAQEKLITVNDINGYKNFDKLSFYVTATCDFGLYDDPNRSSGAMRLLTAKGGGIGTFTASREVFQSSNRAINGNFYKFVFDKESNGKMPDLGHVFKNAKNASIINVQNRSYTMFADPSLVLAYPKHNVEITKINGKAVGVDTIKALAKLEVEGNVLDQSTNALLTNFNGVVTLDLFDKANIINTLGQSGDPKIAFSLMDNTIQSAQASVKNGTFKFTFVVPKDLNYKFDKGKFSFYAFDKKTVSDGAGYNDDVIIGGTNPNAPEDNTPPEISLFMEDSTFRPNGLTSSKPLLLVKLFDENGINIARSGIGHEITGVVDKKENDIIILNENYISEVDDYKRGRVSYRLDSLADGEHKITVTAWDTYNNSSQKSLDFIVASSNKLAINQMFNYPNPANEYTNFTIGHNRIGEEIEMILQIFDQSGNFIKDFKEDIDLKTASLTMRWDIKESAGYNISDGIYVYRCTIRSKSDNSVAQSFQKLVIIR